MTYYESAEGVKITRLRVYEELRRHSVAHTIDEFDRDVQPDSNGLYLASDVLDWLGY